MSSQKHQVTSFQRQRNLNMQLEKTAHVLQCLYLLPREMTSEEMQCLNPLINIAIAVKNTNKPNGKNVVTCSDVLTNVVTLMY